MDFHTAAQQIMWSRRVLRQFTKASSLGTPALAHQKSSMQDGENEEEAEQPAPGMQPAVQAPPFALKSSGHLHGDSSLQQTLPVCPHLGCMHTLSERHGAEARPPQASSHPGQTCKPSGDCLFPAT